MTRALLSLYEMPRPKGAIAPATRAAMELARAHRDENGEPKPFTAWDFADWVGQSGGANTNPLSLQTTLRNMTAARRSEVDQFKPLIQHRKGKSGRGGAGDRGTWIYAYGSGAGRDEDEDELARMGFRKVPNDPTPGANAPAQEPDEEEPQGSFSSGDEENWDEPDLPATDDEIGLEPDGPEDSGHSVAGLFPHDDEMTGREKEKLLQLTDRGFGPENPIWQQIAQAHNDIEAHRIINGSKLASPELKVGAQVLAKAIFRNLDKDWDAPSAPARKGEGLSRLYGVGESLTDPVDFDQTSGLRRVMRLRRR